MGSYFKKLVGSRLYLSPMDPDDAPVFTRWLNDLEVTRNITLAHVQITLHGEREALERLSHEHCYSIVQVEGNHLIGNCGYHNVDHINRTAELGIFIGDRENRGKGYGQEAIALLLEYGFNILNLHSIMLKVYAYNDTAQHCYAKCGFREIGRRRQARCISGEYFDEIYMDILESEFACQKN